MAENQYLQPFFDSLSQGVQVAQHLKAAAAQQAQLDRENQFEQNRQALDQQKYDTSQQNTLSGLLQNGAGELVPSDGMRPAQTTSDSSDTSSAPSSSGTAGALNTSVPAGQPAADSQQPWSYRPDVTQVANSPQPSSAAAAPSYYQPAPQAANSPAPTSTASPASQAAVVAPSSISQSLQQASGTTPAAAAPLTQQAQQPRQSYDPNRILTVAGRKVYIKTPEEQNQQGKIRVTKAMSDDTQGIMPEGTYIDPAHADIITNMMSSLAKPAKGEKELTDKSLPVQAVETAAAMLAKKANITLDPSKPNLSQLPIELQGAAFSLAKEFNADPDLRADRQALAANTLATGASTRESAVQNRIMMGLKMEEEKQKTADKVAAGGMLNAAGKTVLSSTAPAVSQIDQLLTSLENTDPRNPGKQFKDNNSPLNMTLANLKYKLGMTDDDPLHQIGSQVGKLNLASIQAAMPFASKSRSVVWLNAIREHTPKPGDSPALIHSKLTNIERNVLAMQADAKRYQTVKTSTNPARPVLSDEDSQRYYHLALDGSAPKDVPDAPAKALKMATEDGWQVPTAK